VSSGWSQSAKAGVVLVIAAVLVFGASACGSSSNQSDRVVISAGQVDLHHADLQPPPGYTITTDKHGAVRLVAGKGTGKGNSAAGSSGSTADTIPLAGEDPTTKFFGSVGSFSSCLKGLNVKFIGVPSAANPNSPANDPTYIKALSTCAAKSGIVQALKDQQSAQDNLTPAQIKLQNKGYLKWRDCMIGRGWGIPEPKPDSKGRLFAFGAGGGGGGNPGAGFKAPPGQDIVTSKDVSECATSAQNAVSPNSGG
jgi:hypothetical protein